jgi:hypothetical protein
MKRNTRRAAFAALIGIAATGGVLASAASLGVNGNTLGAGTTVIASCDTDGVALNYAHSYASAAPGAGSYRTTGVTVSGIAAACAGKRVDVTLRNAANASLGSGFATIPATSPYDTTITFATSADAAAVEGAAVVIAD